MAISEKEFQQVWSDTLPKGITSQDVPKGFVLGGQSGAGKSYLIQQVKNELNNDVLVINGDDFRKYHPNYEELQREQGKNSSKFTATFAGEMTEAVFKKAVANKYNIVIEGTFRTVETPLKTLKILKEHAYNTSVYVKVTPAKESWQNCLDRYDRMLELNPSEARFTDKNHHDLIVKNLAVNVETVSKSPYVDNLNIYTKSDKIYDSHLDKDKDVKKTIQKVLDKEVNIEKKKTFKLKHKEQKNYQKDLDLEI